MSIGIKAAVEPRVTYPARRRFGQVARAHLNKASAATPGSGCRDGPAFALRSRYLAHDDHPGFNFLFRLRQRRNHCSSFIEHLVHALQLTALDCVLHGFISNEGEFRLAVSKILKQNHVVGTFYSLMFYS